MATARAIELATFQVECAEPALADARRGYVAARRAIGDANWGVFRGITRDRRSARSLAVRGFNAARVHLCRAELALVARQAALAALTAAGATAH